MSNTPVVTRFAPSPTGYLHIGSVRTALFSWLYARHYGGKFLLRIEDTDQERSMTEATDKILEGLTWMGINWDGDVVHQSDRRDRHREVAYELLSQGKAYKCYCTREELETMREAARTAKQPPRYNGYWRDRPESDAPVGTPYVIRLKAPQEGETVLQDRVQGEVRVRNDQLDDMILLRSDGSPTYMVSVVVDDYDMGVTHIIRGDDHLTNSFRQAHICQAMGWPQPVLTHIPLIHGPDGTKLSKRHGALGADAYEDMGFLPEAMANYLLRLGWAHGDDEIISQAQAIDWFDGTGIGKGPARFDVDKLTHLNAYYIRQRPDGDLLTLIEKRLPPLSPVAQDRILRGMDGLKQRAKTLVELAESAHVYRELPQEFSDKAVALMTEPNRVLLAELRDLLPTVGDWTHDALEDFARNFADHRQIGLGKVAQPLRVALTGSVVSPGIFEVMEILGREESLHRLQNTLGRTF